MYMYIQSASVYLSRYPSYKILRVTSMHAGVLMETPRTRVYAWVRFYTHGDYFRLGILKKRGVFKIVFLIFFLLFNTSFKLHLLLFCGTLWASALRFLPVFAALHSLSLLALHSLSITLKRGGKIQVDEFQKIDTTSSKLA